MELFKIIHPSLILAPYIKHYWILEINSVTSPVKERTIPTGYMQLIFHRGDQLFSSTDNKLQPKAFISGQTTSYSEIIASSKTHMIVVVFQPFGAKAFFGIPMSEFNTQNISIDDLNDIELIDLEKQILDSSNNDDYIKLIENFLIKRLESFYDYNFKRLTTVINTINNNNEIKIKSLADIACLSYKQFSRVFNEYIGSSPKDFARIIRLQRALYILQHKPQINFTELAFECGYYDLSHLIKEFKTLTGYTLSEYLNICQPHSDYFN